MKKLTFMLTLVLFLLCSPALAQGEASLTARAHIENVGWTETGSDENSHILLGTPGSGLRLEAFSLQTSDPDLGARYQSYVQDEGWQSPAENGGASGTEGQGRKIEALCVQLTGGHAPDYTLYYRTYVEGYGWLDWTANFGASGTINHNFRCEAVEMLLRPAAEPAPGPMTTPAIQATSQLESRHMVLVNQYRREHGLSYLTGHPHLKAVADLRVQEISQRFSHIRPNGQPFETAVKSVFPNYHQTGGEISENISLARTPLMAQPEYAFDYLSTYVQQLDKILDESARYMAWSGLATSRMGYSVEIFSGLDTIDFAN